MKAHRAMEGAAPPRDLPSLARTAAGAANQSAITTRSHWAMAAIIVEKSRLAGELVSTAFWREIRSASCSWK